MPTLGDLIALCAALLPARVSLTPAEFALLGAAEAVDRKRVEELRSGIEQGADPLGDAFSQIRSAQERRASGAVYTPKPIVDAMVSWLSRQGPIARIVDPGAGSGRFIATAGKAFPDARLVAVEKDPLAALTLRAHLHAQGLSRRVEIVVGDYRQLSLDRIAGTTAFLGNPPYVRHHGIDEAWKAWYASRFAALGIKASALAGLHLHFFLQTRLLAQAGDIGAFVTSAEWLDVNYGSALRKLLTDELGGLALHVLEPAVEAFPGTATTAAITCFRVGETRRPIQMRAVAQLADLNGLANGLAKGQRVARQSLRDSSKWSTFVWPRPQPREGEIELGELFRVHRGQVTGANSVWIAGQAAGSLPARVQVPAITKARDLIEAGARLGSAESLRRVVDLPAELDEFDADDRRRIQAFIAWARAQGADQGYIARHRKAWWSVGLRAPAPILCTYMARRAPQFTLNSCHARHINVAHGLYPREALSARVLDRVVSWLNVNVHVGSGRTYAGGLTKFEPKEIERLRIPRLEALDA